MPKLIVALDTDLERAKAIVDSLGDSVSFYKVGYKLFLPYGREIISFLKDRGRKVFLDLKFYDIPNTMKNAAIEVASMGIDMFNIHISAGKDAAKAMLDAMPKGNRPLLIGVTILTSREAMADEVLDLAVDAYNWGLDGVVCSVGEVRDIKGNCGADFMCVCPGIRLNRGNDDQKRVFTPKDAVSAGADYIVVGRPILQAANPKQVADEINKSLSC